MAPVRASGDPPRFQCEQGSPSAGSLDQRPPRSCFMGSCRLRDLYPCPWQVLSDVKLSKSAFIASGLKINVCWTLKADLFYLFVYHAALVSTSCWSYWLESWKAGSLGPFHLFYLHPEALTQWWFTLLWWFIIFPLQVAFFPTQAQHTPP